MSQTAIVFQPQAEDRPLTVDEELVRVIAELGTASEVEVQARTLRTVSSLRQGIEALERRGIVRRLPGFFGGGFGDAVELTREGYWSWASRF